MKIDYIEREVKAHIGSLLRTMPRKERERVRRCLSKYRKDGFIPESVMKEPVRVKSVSIKGDIVTIDLEVDPWAEGYNEIARMGKR